MSLTREEKIELESIESELDHRALFKNAEKVGKIRTFTFKRFKKEKDEEIPYILLSKKLCHPDAERDRKLVELIEKEGRTGFFSAYINGDVYICVVEKNVTNEFQPFVALHEYVEYLKMPPFDFDLSLLDEDYNQHKEACKSELWRVFQQGRDFALSYVAWLSDEYFNQVNQTFLENRDRSNTTPLEIAVSFVGLISSDKEAWFREFPWLKVK